MNILFCGSYTVNVADNGECKIPESLEYSLMPGAEYEVFYSIDHKNDDGENVWLLSFAFEGSGANYDEKPLASGKVTQDKKIIVPEEYREIMKGECLLFGVLKALELTIFPLEEFFWDEEELKALGI